MLKIFFLYSLIFFQFKDIYSKEIPSKLCYKRGVEVILPSAAVAIHRRTRHLDVVIVVPTVTVAPFPRLPPLPPPLLIC